MPRELFPIAERRFGKQPSELGLSAATRAIYSPDGRWVATAYENGTVAVWDIKSKDRSASQLLVDGHALLTVRGEFFGRGTRLLTSAGDNTTRIWDVARGTQLRKLQGTGYRGAAAVAWHQPTQSAIVVSGSDNRMTPAWLWQIRDGVSEFRQPLLADYAKNRLKQQLGAAGIQAGRVRAMTGIKARSFRTRMVSTSAAEFDRMRILKRKIPDVTAVAFDEDGKQFVIGNSEGHCFVYRSDEPLHLRLKLLISSHTRVKCGPPLSSPRANH